MQTKPLTGKKCYDHMGGKLGSVLLLFYLEQGWLEPEENGKSTVYKITEEGYDAFAKMGLDLRVKKENENGHMG